MKKLNKILIFTCLLFEFAMSQCLGYLNSNYHRDLTYGAGFKPGSLKINYALTPFGVFDRSALGLPDEVFQFR